MWHKIDWTGFGLRIDHPPALELNFGVNFQRYIKASDGTCTCPLDNFRTPDDAGNCEMCNNFNADWYNIAGDHLLNDLQTSYGFDPDEFRCCTPQIDPFGRSLSAEAHFNS